MNILDSKHINSSPSKELDIGIETESTWVSSPPTTPMAFGRAAEKRLHTEIRDVNLAPPK